MIENKKLLIGILAVVALAVVGIGAFALGRIPTFAPTPTGEESGKCIDSNAQCKGELDGTGCTVGVWCDRQGRVCGGQSCVGLGLGQCHQERCLQLEEYENLSKNPQTDCLGSCRCMKECNEKGPTYFIPAEEGGPECSVNSINKICCCSGV